MAISFFESQAQESRWKFCAWVPHLLGGPGHFAEPIIREILGLPFFDRLQNKVRHELRLVALGIIGCRSAAGRISHPVLAEVRRRDEGIDFADDDAVLSSSARAARLKPRSARFEDE
jgi:hypothetical protein